MPGNDLALVISVFNEAPNVMTLVADLPAWLKDIDGEAIFFLVSQPCSHAHHIRYPQPRGLALKVSDEFTAPLCAIHHADDRTTGNETQCSSTRFLLPWIYGSFRGKARNENPSKLR